jgi:hypothetical protein
MSREEISQAIPPAYSRYIGEQFKLTLTSKPELLGRDPEYISRGE